MKNKESTTDPLIVMRIKEENIPSQNTLSSGTK